MRHNIGLYLRVSTDEQALRQEGSLDSQKHRLQAFVDIRNVQDQNWGKVVDVYTDDGISAKDTNRPAFQRMMKDVRKGRVNLILVTDLSRLSRNINVTFFLTWTNSTNFLLLDFLPNPPETSQFAAFETPLFQLATSTPAGDSSRQTASPQAPQGSGSYY